MTVKLYDQLFFSMGLQTKKLDNVLHRTSLLVAIIRLRYSLFGFIQKRGAFDLRFVKV